MLTAEDFLLESIKAYDEAKKEWKMFIDKPDYCTIQSTYLHKKYIICMDSLIKVSKIYKQIKLLEDQIAYLNQ
jgi:hypothetical protein